MSIQKKILFMLVTLLLCFGVLEGVCRIGGAPGTSDYIERRLIESGLKFRKSADEYRIFFFGESTMHGNHLYPRSTIDTWVTMYMEDVLDEAEAGRVTCVNFARLGEDSRFILQSVRETIPYQPDVIVVYSAHNDFVQLQKRKEHLAQKRWTEELIDALKAHLRQSYFLSTLVRLNIRLKMVRRKQREAHEQKRDEWYYEEPREYNQETDYLQPHSREFRHIQNAWEQNIRHIIEVAQAHDIPVVLYAGLSRWSDFPPFMSVHNKSLSEAELRTWQQVFTKAEALAAKEEYKQARKAYERALNLDRDYALTYFRLAVCLEKIGEYEEARAYYRLANDKDYFPIRAPSVVNAFYKRLQARTIPGVYVIDTQALFEAAAPRGIIRDDLVMDQLHPTIQGQALMAQAVVRTIYAHELFLPRSAWHWRNEKPWREMQQRLDLDDDFLVYTYARSAFYVGSYYDQAIEYIHKALAIRPHSIALRSMLAWKLLKKGAEEDAYALYRELYREDPQRAQDFIQKYPAIATHFTGNN